MTAQVLNSLGLVLDVLGVCVVFKYGWPQPDVSETMYRILEQTDTDPVNATKRKFHKTMSLLGLLCLVVGFGFQLIATWIR